MNMITKTVIFAAIFKYALASHVFIETENTGSISSDRTPKVVEYYTALSTYGVIPNKEMLLQFQLKACANAYILFSESYNITNAKQFYEIVIGAGGNKLDLIRRRYKNGTEQELIRKLTKSLYCHQYRNFSSYGNVQLRRYSVLILNLTDQDPIPVNGFGIRTGYGNGGHWIFELKVNKSVCQCSCEYKSKLDFWSSQNLTGQTRDKLMEMLNPKLEAIKKELKVNKYNLSSNRRRRTSAADNRKSAQHIGIVGTIFLCFVIGLIVMIDITAVQKDKKVSDHLQKLDQCIKYKELVK